MVSAVPAVVIAAASSGSGKTTIATGLMGALRAAGRRVAPFKVGPDYIDPGYHALAAGRVGRNLDPVLVGAHRIGPLYAHGSHGADIAVIEGVMGLFDGRIVEEPAAAADPIAAGSTAEVAVALGAPVVMVVDGTGQGQSVAAMLHGFCTYDPRVRICGVILNRVGSPRHEQVLRQACERVGLPVFGAIRRDDQLSVPARHLGLVPAAESGGPARAAVEAMSRSVAAGVDLDALVRVAAATEPAAGVAPWTPADEVGEPAPGRPLVAVAGGRAFTFGYAEHPELLAAAGAQVVTFDPLSDRLPEHTSAMIIGGGFPEEHAAELSANTALRRDVVALAAAGAPIVGECAGLLYLARELDGHQMTGVLPVDGRFSPRLTLGYRDAVASTGSPFHDIGDRVVGHEFHRSVVVAAGGGDTGTCAQPRGDIAPAWTWRRVDPVTGARSTVDDGVVIGSVHASYLHLHPASTPRAVRRLVAAAARWADAAEIDRRPVGDTMTRR
ncbi:cobyrinate a,c-diamide synthase [Gordonia jinhuaensis]|uniref:Hydrogenobyrinate a,c-diamide synthase n=1 Tax=Gordonia jinhuaensis TaxID=1517702 RepID=A0A916WR77_9ACTN|nr:hydrogenobyrinate a,c-diamide synthase [Gordonia jinhuaensis]